MQNSAPPAFISYSREDQQFVLRLARDLKAAGAAVWVDQLELVAGRPWDNAIEDAIRFSQRIIVVLSPASARSENVKDEIVHALDAGKSIVPVLYQDCVVPLRLTRAHRVDFRSDYQAGLMALLGVLHDAPGAAKTVPMTAAKPAKARLWLAVAAVVLILCGLGAWGWARTRTPAVEAPAAMSDDAIRAQVDDRLAQIAGPEVVLNCRLACKPDQAFLNVDVQQGIVGLTGTVPAAVADRVRQAKIDIIGVQRVNQELRILAPKVAEKTVALPSRAVATGVPSPMAVRADAEAAPVAAAHEQSADELRAAAYVATGKNEMAARDYLSARNHFDFAHRLDPENQAAKAGLAEANMALDHER